MRVFAIAALFATASGVKLNAEWPSVAKCGEGQNGAVSSDDFACDHNSKNPTVVDGSVTDHRFQYANPGYYTQVQTAEQINFRPPIKCKDPVHGNPISCDHDDIDASNEENPKNEMGETEVKVIEGGPSTHA